MLSLNEIKKRAIEFADEWRDESSENAEAKSFWNDFFHVFGVNRRRVASFEEPVKKLNDKQGFIDLFWKGNLIVEHKSKGRDLEKAYTQAVDYFAGLKDYELPKYVLVSDFANFKLYDLEDDLVHSFTLSELHKNIHLFGFISGYEKKTYKEEDPANIKAAELMGKVHDALTDSGFVGHKLEVYLVRLLFMMFAEDTGLFEKALFMDYLEAKTNEDGSDTGSRIQEIFQILNTPREQRSKNLDEFLAKFPYVNGQLFEENLEIAYFNSEMRDALLRCCYFDWSKISPAIFGSLFQSIMDKKKRRNLGAHYTTEQNILKLIKPLFLDELWSEFKKVKSNKRKLEEFHQKIAKLKFLDPACGCGNFLIITYRELRLLEIEILKILQKDQAMSLDISMQVLISVDNFYGFEIEEFPARIAEVAMWLVDHQMNMRVSEEFGNYFVRLPLKKSAHIVNDNALRMNWDEAISHGSRVDNQRDDFADNQRDDFVLADNQLKQVVAVADDNKLQQHASDFRKGDHDRQQHALACCKGNHDRQQHALACCKVDYILGNPPFIGSKLLNDEQKKEMRELFRDVKGAGVMDFVTAWYIKAAQYIQNTNIKVALVSTNSISQGEQVGILWNELFSKYNIKIHFAHRTFAWSSEARGKAQVYVVIIGFANFDVKQKLIYEYENVKGEAHEKKVKNINPYLIEGHDLVILKRRKAISDIPEMIAGNVAYDSGFLIFTEEEMYDFIQKEPSSKKWFRKLIGGQELINKGMRYCLWFVDINPGELRKMKYVLERMELVKKSRLSAKDKGTHKLALRPHQFRDLNNPERYIGIPKTSSENRKYIPMAFLTKEFIPSDSIRIVPDASYYHFGILTSEMHMAWMKYTCGRLESRFRYSKDIVYNNFPFPQNPTDKQIKTVEEKAKKVLEVREKFPDSSLADLYHPLTMPPELVKAHFALDKAVDACYRSAAFKSDTERIEFLFGIYGEMVK
jgi:hypothetical protein